MTPAQHATLMFIASYLDCHGYSPTQREIAAHLGTTVATVWKHLIALESYGCIRRRKHGTRAIVLDSLKPRQSRQKTSRYKGVSRNSNGYGWRVDVWHRREKVFVAWRKSEVEAARLYDRYVRKHGLNKPLNFPDAA